MDDGYLLDRWESIFKAGLLYATGSHGTVMLGYGSVGYDYAQNLQMGDVIGDAWFDAIFDGYTDNDAAWLASGKDAGHCKLRRDNMTWQDQGAYQKLSNGEVKWGCWYKWTSQETIDKG